MEIEPLADALEREHHQAEPGLAAPIFVMLREHAQVWGTLDSLERERDADAGRALCKRLTVQRPGRPRPSAWAVPACIGRGIGGRCGDQA
jgi:hypothetical protein